MHIGDTAKWAPESSHPAPTGSNRGVRGPQDMSDEAIGQPGEAALPRPRAATGPVT